MIHVTWIHVSTWFFLSYDGCMRIFYSGLDWFPSNKIWVKGKIIEFKSFSDLCLMSGDSKIRTIYFKFCGHHSFISLTILIHIESWRSLSSRNAQIYGFTDSGLRDSKLLVCGEGQMGRCVFVHKHEATRNCPYFEMSGKYFL